MFRPISCLLLVAICLATPAIGFAAEVWDATDIRTVIDFYPEVLRDLGLEVEDLRPSSPAVKQNRLSVLAADAPAFQAAGTFSMKFNTTRGHFEGVFSGAVQHQGGFELRWSDGQVSLRGFTVRPGKKPRSLEVLAGDGTVIFNGTHLHWAVDTEDGLLEMFNVDLRLTREMALRLGREALEGHAVGTLSLTAKVQGAPGSSAEDGIPTCTPNDWSGEQDVQLIQIGQVIQRARANGQVVMVPSATLKNVGTANVPWNPKFSGPQAPYNNDQHPLLTWSTFRLGEGVIHQLGVSDIKHAFLTLNFNCDPGACTNGNTLGLGCEDVYGTSTNSSNGDLAPRPEILAASGVWAHCNEPTANTPSHFDQDGNCSQDYSGAGEDNFTHGLVVQESDLSDDTASYIFSAWYLVRDDINIFNTMGYRPINPEFSGSSWTFGFQGGLVNSSPVDAWIPTGTDETNQKNEVLDLGAGPGAGLGGGANQGHIQLAVNVTDLQDGFFRYDYALMNHDFDQGLDGFSIPLLSGTSVRTPSFRDIDQEPLNDWSATIAADSVSWSAPDPDSFQRWGLLYNFSFEADATPIASPATLNAVNTGRPETYEISTRTPALTAIFVDDFESGDSTAWSTTSP